MELPVTVSSRISRVGEHITNGASRDCVLQEIDSWGTPICNKWHLILSSINESMNELTSKKTDSLSLAISVLSINVQKVTLQ